MGWKLLGFFDSSIGKFIKTAVYLFMETFWGRRKFLKKMNDITEINDCRNAKVAATWHWRRFEANVLSAILLVHGNIFSRHVFLEKISYFILSSHKEKKSEFFDPCQKLCERNILASWHKKSSKSAKLLSISSYEHFQEIQFYGKVYIFIIIFG